MMSWKNGSRTILIHLANNRKIKTHVRLQNTSAGILSTPEDLPSLTVLTTLHTSSMEISSVRRKSFIVTALPD
jgi:hypothetical protein